MGLCFERKITQLLININSVNSIGVKAFFTRTVKVTVPFKMGPVLSCEAVYT